MTRASDKSLRAYEVGAAIYSLATVPYFDFSLAHELMSTNAGEHGIDGKSALALERSRRILLELAARGGIEPVGSLFAVPEGIRRYSLAEFQQNDAVRLSRSAEMFWRHGSRRLKKPLVSALGAWGYALIIRTFDVIAHPNSPDKIQDFVHYVYSAKHFGRPDDVSTSIDLMRMYLGFDTRLLALMASIEMWNRGDESTAKQSLFEVLSQESGDADVVTAVTHHLLGVAYLKTQDFAAAEHELESSINHFRTLGDRRGLVKATTSLARAKREFGVMSNDFRRVRDSIDLFESVIKMTERWPNALEFEKTMGLGRTEIGKSRAYSALELYDRALDSANSAVDILSLWPDQLLWARENLADIQLKLGQSEAAAATLEAHIDESLANGTEDRAVIAAIISLIRANETTGRIESSDRLLERGFELAQRHELGSETAELYLLRSTHVFARWRNGGAGKPDDLKRALHDVAHARVMFERLGNIDGVSRSWKLQSALEIERIDANRIARKSATAPKRLSTSLAVSAPVPQATETAGRSSV